MSLFRGKALSQFLDEKPKGLSTRISTLPLADVRDPAFAGKIEDLWIN